MTHIKKIVLIGLLFMGVAVLGITLSEVNAQQVQCGPYTLIARQLTEMNHKIVVVTRYEDRGEEFNHIHGELWSDGEKWMYLLVNEAENEACVGGNGKGLSVVPLNKEEKKEDTKKE